MQKTIIDENSLNITRNSFISSFTGLFCLLPFCKLRETKDKRKFMTFVNADCNGCESVHSIIESWGIAASCSKYAPSSRTSGKTTLPSVNWLITGARSGRSFSFSVFASFIFCRRLIICPLCFSHSPRMVSHCLVKSIAGFGWISIWV